MPNPTFEALSRVDNYVNGAVEDVSNMPEFDRDSLPVEVLDAWKVYLIALGSLSDAIDGYTGDYHRDDAG